MLRRRWRGAAITSLALLVHGCAERKPHAIAWTTAISVRPRVPLPAPGYQPPAIDEMAPDLRFDFPPPPSRLVTVRLPTRPQISVRPAPEASSTAKTEPPLLAPQLSGQEVAAAQQQMNESISVAQQNLAAAKGHKWNATQADLASKVNTFLDESKVAVKEGDWTRAKNLAKKAQVLSEELAQSF
jgi:hypothetical protein